MVLPDPYICDRRVYDKKGKWKNPNQDGKTPVFYFIKEQPTLVASYNNGLDELKEQMTIVVFGEHPFAIGDKFECLNRTYIITAINPIYIEHNVLVQDLLRDRIGSMELVLE